MIENTNAGYVNVSGELSLGGMPFKFNVGVRDEYTDVTTIGLGQQPTSLTVQPLHAILHSWWVSDRPRRSPETTATSICCPILTWRWTLPINWRSVSDASRTLTRPPLN